MKQLAKLFGITSTKFSGKTTGNKSYYTCTVILLFFRQLLSSSCQAVRHFVFRPDFQKYHMNNVKKKKERKKKPPKVLKTAFKPAFEISACPVARGK